MSLTVQNLSKSFNGHVAVKDLSFEFTEPGVFAFLGTNGAGKSTSIRMILNMLKKDSGTVLWRGKELNVLEENIGYLSEERGLYPKATVMEQLSYISLLKGQSLKEARKEVLYWCDVLGLNDYINSPAEQLSKGNQQKVQLISALLNNPTLLVLDEPFSGLDPVNTKLIKTVLEYLISQGVYIILSSHQMHVVEEYCENILILDNGNSVVQGNLNEIKKSLGSNNFLIKTSDDISKFITDDMSLVNKTVDTYEFKNTSDNLAYVFLKKLLDNNINIIQFEIKEPSLQEIFIEKVGK